MTADAGCACAEVHTGLERWEITAVIPAKAQPIHSPVPKRRFCSDARRDVLKCPRGKRLKPGRQVKHARLLTSRARDCRGCELAHLCLSEGRTNKAVVLCDDDPTLLCAWRRRERWSAARHLWGERMVGAG